MSLLGVAGFALMILIVALLLWGKSTPAVVFILLPILVGFAVGFNPTDMSEYIKAGVSSVSTTAILFIFAVLFFGVMNDAGVFDRIVNKVLKVVGGNVLLLMFATVLIAFIGHLDGSGATTLLIAIPPLLPIYKKMNVRPIVLLCITTLTMGVMNIVPWGGPCGRTAAALEVGTADIWKYCIPAQIFGIAMILLFCVFFAKMEKKRGAGYVENAVVEESAEEIQTENELHRPKLFWFNIALIVAVVLMLTLTKVATHVTFMVALAIGLMVNYPSQKMQAERIKAHATDALTMAFTALASGVLIGHHGQKPDAGRHDPDGSVCYAREHGSAPAHPVCRHQQPAEHGRPRRRADVRHRADHQPDRFRIRRSGRCCGCSLPDHLRPCHLHHADDRCHLHGSWPDECGAEGAHRLLLQVGVPAGRRDAGLRGRDRDHPLLML